MTPRRKLRPGSLPMLAIDLFCGLGGWTEGLMAEGYDVIGFDIERHDYGTGGYPDQLVLQDVTTLHGSQFRDAALIVASPPCQEFSFMAMPWSRAKQIAAALRGEISRDGLMVPFPEGYKGSRTVAELTALFDACFRIQREACEAAGRYIPLVVENVKGAQPWVGKAKANFGSYYLWGDVGMVGRRVVAGMYGAGVAPRKAQKCNPDGTNHGTGSWFAVADSKERGARKTPVGNCSSPLWKDREISRYAHPTPQEMEAHGFGFRFDGSGGSFQTASVEAVKAPGLNWSDRSQRGQDFTRAAGQHATKNAGGSWFAVANNTESGHSRNPVHEAVKASVKDRKEYGGNFGWDGSQMRQGNSKSAARKFASAMIAKIPFTLSRYIARAYKPAERRQPGGAG